MRHPFLPANAASSPLPLIMAVSLATLAPMATRASAAEPPAAPRPDPAGGITLERIVALASQRNERARVSVAQAEAAEGRLSRARSFFFPELTLTGTYTRRLFETVRNVGSGQVTIAKRNALSTQANLVVPLFDARLFPLYRQAKLEGLSAALTAAEERRRLGYEAADAFLMVLSQQQVAEAAARRLEFSRVTFREARARAQAGLVSSNDVTRGELEAATAERELSSARAGARTARLELGHLANEELGERALLAPEALLGQAAVLSMTPQSIIATGLERRLDVRAGKARAEALAQAAKEPARRAIPSLAGIAQYRVTNEQGFAGRIGDGFAGVTATWQLWDGGERSAEGSERRALARAGNAEQEARERTVALDVRRALVTLESAQSTLKVAAQAGEVARRNVSETGELYRQGLVRALEVADANLRLFEAEVALARERYALALAYLDLRAAAGENPPGQQGDR